MQVDKNNESTGKVVLKKGCPEYPQKAFDRVQGVIEFCSEGDAIILANFLALSQIQYVRLRRFTDEITGKVFPERAGFSEENFNSIYFDAMELYFWSERCLHYARLESDEISDLGTAEQALNYLSQRHFLKSESLSNFVKKRWLIKCGGEKTSNS